MIWQDSGMSVPRGGEACLLSTAVIPGRIEDANLESIVPHECWEKWIPGSMLRIAPE